MSEVFTCFFAPCRNVTYFQLIILRVCLGLVTTGTAVDKVRGIRGHMGIKMVHQGEIMTERILMREVRQD